MAIEVEAQTVVARKRDEVFHEAAGKAENIARFFTGYGLLIPGITAASIDGDGVMREGALRSVKLSDGSAIRERVTRFEAPRVHGYEMAEMNALQRLVCTNMISEWTFSDEGGATRVVWRYTILPKGAAMTPVAWLIARLFERAMQRCLDNLAAAVR